MTRHCAPSAAALVFPLLLVALGAAPARAQPLYTAWQHDPATPGNWFDPTHWTAGVPQAGQLVYGYVNNGGTAQISSGDAYGGDWFFLGGSGGQSGTLELSGAGRFSANAEVIASEATGRFVQSGGTHTTSYLHFGSASSAQGLYELQDGQLSVHTLVMGDHGTDQLTHSGGASTISGALHLGIDYNGEGTYALSGSGQLAAAVVYVGNVVSYGPPGIGHFRQTGGTHTVGYLAVRAPGDYLFSAGTLRVTGGLQLSGTLDLAGQAVSVDAGDDTLVDLSGTIVGAAQATLSVGANSLTILPPGLDPKTVFANFTTAGRIHTRGTDLVIQPGESFAGTGILDDIVRAAGTIRGSAQGGLDLRGGIFVSAGADVDLSAPLYNDWDGPTGVLNVVNDVSGISGGQLTAASQYIGGIGSLPGVGRFRQTGGANTILSTLGIGYYGLGTVSEGTYELIDGQLAADSAFVGYDGGTGRLVHRGGAHAVQGLVIGSWGGTGTYELSDSGQLTVLGITLGDEGGAGRFVQTGGTATVSDLFLGSSSGTGTYELGGTGQLSAQTVHIGFAGTGRFVQTGGTHTITDTLHIGGASDIEIHGHGTYELSGGSLNAKTLRLEGGTLSIADAAAQVAVSDTLDLQYGGALSVVPGATLLTNTALLSAATVLHVKATGSLASIGDHAWPIIAAANGISGQLAQAAAVDEHLGYGVFYRDVIYGDEMLQGHVFQAAAGDVDGDRDVDVPDIQAILRVAKFGSGQAADWTQGDFTGDSLVTAADIQLLLRLNLFSKGPYAAGEEDGVASPALQLKRTLEGLLIDTQGATINGYVLTSAAGVLTGDTADNLGLWREDSDRTISGQMFFALSGEHLLGHVIGAEWDGIDLGKDLTMTYTLAGQPGLYQAQLVVPEPSGLALAATVGLLLLALARNARMRKK